MAKGMSLEEFKNALSSDATIENEKLKQELNQIKQDSSEQIEKLKDDLEQYKEWHTQLCNRCFLYSQGMLCISCEMECEHGYTCDDITALSHYMKKNNIPRTPETYQVANVFLMKRRNKRKNQMKG